VGIYHSLKIGFILDIRCYNTYTQPRLGNHTQSSHTICEETTADQVNHGKLDLLLVIGAVRCVPSHNVHCPSDTARRGSDDSSRPTRHAVLLREDRGTTEPRWGCGVQGVRKQPGGIDGGVMSVAERSSWRLGESEGFEAGCGNRGLR